MDPRARYFQAPRISYSDRDNYHFGSNGNNGFCLIFTAKVNHSYSLRIAREQVSIPLYTRLTDSHKINDEFLSETKLLINNLDSCALSKDPRFDVVKQILTELVKQQELLFQDPLDKDTICEIFNIERDEITAEWLHKTRTFITSSKILLLEKLAEQLTRHFKSIQTQSLSFKEILSAYANAELIFKDLPELRKKLKFEYEQFTIKALQALEEKPELTLQQTIIMFRLLASLFPPEKQINILQPETLSYLLNCLKIELSNILSLDDSKFKSMAEVQQCLQIPLGKIFIIDDKFKHEIYNLQHDIFNKKLILFVNALKNTEPLKLEELALLTIPSDKLLTAEQTENMQEINQWLNNYFTSKRDDLQKLSPDAYALVAEALNVTSIRDLGAALEKLKLFLSTYWQTIKENPADNSKPQLNKFCYELAKLIDPLNPSRYLMPNVQLQNPEDVITTTHINECQFGEFMLNDDKKGFIVLSQLFENAAKRAKRGEKPIYVRVSSPPPGVTGALAEVVELSGSEKARLFEFFPEAKQMEEIAQNFHNTNLLGAITDLREGLRKGQKGGSGSEYESGLEAAIAITAFIRHFNGLTLLQRYRLRKLTAPDTNYTLGQILDLFSNPNHKDRKRVENGPLPPEFCIQLRGEDLDKIIDYNQHTLAATACKGISHAQATEEINHLYDNIQKRLPVAEQSNITSSQTEIERQQLESRFATSNETSAKLKHSWGEFFSQLVPFIFKCVSSPRETYRAIKATSCAAVFYGALHRPSAQREHEHNITVEAAA